MKPNNMKKNMHLQRTKRIVAVAGLLAGADDGRAK